MGRTSELEKINGLVEKCCQVSRGPFTLMRRKHKFDVAADDPLCPEGVATPATTPR